MANKIKGICIKVHPLFFDTLFEPKRKNYEQKFKVNMSQIKVSELMAKEFLANNQPQIKKKNYSYFPKKRRRKFP